MGNYERFLNRDLGPEDYMTSGMVYQTVINRERALEYGGKCVEAVPHVRDEIMHRIAAQVEADPGYKARVHFTEVQPDATTADALASACAQIAETLPISGVIVFTGSGSTARRVARERPGAPMLVLTPSHKTARRLALLWGCYAVHTKDIGSFEEMIAKGKRMALRHGFGTAGDKLITLAGVPFGTPGSTNLLHIVTLSGDELKR